MAKRENKRTTKANLKIDAAFEKISHGKTGELRQEEEEKKSEEDLSEEAESNIGRSTKNISINNLLIYTDT